MDENRSGTFSEGVRDGLPIGLGYLSVAFSFGIMAITNGLTTLQAILISATNITSAGQVAGVGIMAAGGGLLAMILSQLVINMRYSLMAISLSQKTDKTMTRFMRILLAYGITDEIFGVAISKKHDIGVRYFAGLTVLPVLGWVSGTALGAFLGNIFPPVLTNALAIGIYGMFVSIVLPKAKQDKVTMSSAALSCLLSCLFFFIPALSSSINSGFAIIISAILAAIFGVFLYKRSVSPKLLKISTIATLTVVSVFTILGVSFYDAPVSQDISAGDKLSWGKFIPLLIAMALTTYLVRMIPFTLFTKKLKSKSVKAFFDYIPYTVLSAMTFPAILYSTGSVIAASFGLLVALILSFFEKSLLTVAVGTGLAALIAGVILMYI
ncbi:MAG: AzlC family ABC transporter permease [Saccharofermentans sp.]|nr:AzlC family ABC transporter permease [Saccharofermentans sp.]